MSTSWMQPLRSLAGKGAMALAAGTVLAGVAASPALADEGGWHRGEHHEHWRWHRDDDDDGHRYGWRRPAYVYAPRYVYAPPRYVYAPPRYVYAPPRVVYGAPSLNFDFRIPLR